MKSKNLIIKDIDNLSYVPPFNEYKYCDEIDSRTAYNLFQQNIVEKENSIIFWMAQLLTKLVGRHSFEPFIFNLGIFKQELRAKPMAWRNLGFTKGNPKAKFNNAYKERGQEKCS